MAKPPTSAPANPSRPPSSSKTCMQRFIALSESPLATPTKSSNAPSTSPATARANPSWTSSRSCCRGEPRVRPPSPPQPNGRTHEQPRDPRFRHTPRKTLQHHPILLTNRPNLPAVRCIEIRRQRNEVRDGDIAVVIDIPFLPRPRL